MDWVKIQGNYYAIGTNIDNEEQTKNALTNVYRGVDVYSLYHYSFLGIAYQWLNSIIVHYFF